MNYSLPLPNKAHPFVESIRIALTLIFWIMLAFIGPAVLFLLHVGQEMGAVVLYTSPNLLHMGAVEQLCMGFVVDIASLALAAAAIWTGVYSIKKAQNIICEHNLIPEAVRTFFG